MVVFQDYLAKLPMVFPVADQKSTRLAKQLVFVIGQGNHVLSPNQGRVSSTGYRQAEFDGLLPTCRMTDKLRLTRAPSCL